ncbi:hypothetical protein SU65_11860 [Flavobacterium psychrophilum]|nr:hypothetical protein SU65_11860 [Flavobacterium psychrophilum]
MIIIFAFSNKNFCQQKSNVGVIIKDTIYKLKENSIYFYNQTSDTIFFQINISENKNDIKSLIPNIFGYQTRTKTKKIILLYPNSNLKYKLKNNVLNELKKGTYYFRTNISKKTNNTNLFINEEKIKFYYY